jgi:glycosyltransferase involved in cell wall biosynthesis
LARCGILVLTTTYPSHQGDWKGAFIHNLILAIKRKGFEVTVLAPSNGEGYGNSTIDGVQVIRFGYFWPRSLERLTVGAGGIPENISKSFLAKFQIIPMTLLFVVRALILSRKADIIYSNWIGAGFVGAIVGTITGKPTVVSFRGDDGYLARDRALWKIATKWVIKKSSYVTAVSSELIRIMKDLGADPQRLSVPRFGVDSQIFYPNCDVRKSRVNLKITFVGSLIPKKGLQDLIEAMTSPQFAKTELVVVGDGYYGTELKRLAGEKLKDRIVEWKGIISPIKVGEVLRESDILVLPSYTEGSPNVIKEAMATALPVIGSRIGGVPELVDHGRTGFLYEPGDIEELRKCLGKLVVNEDMRLKMGANARQRLNEAGLDWDSTAEDFEKIFLATLEKVHEKKRLIV